MPPMTTRTADAEGFVTDDSVAYYMARVRGGTGLITVEMASPEKCGRHRRHEVGIYDDRFIPGLTRLVGEIHRGGAKASIQLGHGGGHTRDRHLRRDADRAVGHSASGLRDHVRDHRAGGDDQGAHRSDHRRPRRRGAARATGRLRLRRSPRRARLSDLAIPRAVREPAQRRIWRQPGKSRPLRSRSFARGESGGAGPGRHLPAFGRRFLSRRLAVQPKDGRSRSGRRRPAPMRCTSPRDIIARCRRRKSCCRR